MMNTKSAVKRILAMALSVALMLTTMPVTALTAYAQEGDRSPAGGTTEPATPTDFVTVLGFSTPAQALTVPLGTSYGDLPLPENLSATVEDEPGPADVPVEWTDEGGYDGDTPGDYGFTGALGAGYILADGVNPPTLTVTVADTAVLRTITAFAELPEDIRWQRTYAPNLPETVEATVGGETAQVPVTWAAEGYDPAAYNAPGLYMFYAKPGEGYTLANGVTAPKITVLLIPMIQTFMAGTGSASKPLQITTAAQLAEISELVNEGELENLMGQNPVYLKLMNDITLTGEWVPIGHDDDTGNYFTGHFDGGGHTISGLKITVDTYDNTGLFGLVDGGSVANLGLVGVSISGGEYVGGVAGWVNGGSVENCYVTGAVSGNACVGGVAGWVALDSSVTNCYSTAAVSGGNDVGGVAGGVNGGSITSCYSTAAISGVDYVGGVAGYVENSSITSCYNTGAVSGRYSVGGVAGLVYKGSVANCYSTGAVSGDHVGGVVGWVENSSVTDCAALNPSVRALPFDAGRVVGFNDGGTLSGNAAFDGILDNSGSTAWSNKGADKINGADLTAASVTDTIGGRFGVGWTTGAGKLPILADVGGPQSDAIPAWIASTSGFITEIHTEADLRALADAVNGGVDYSGETVTLMNNLTLTGEWVPIGHDGTTQHYFYGNFDGGGHTISGLKITGTYDYAGLFGVVVGGSVENLGLVGVSVSGSYDVGGVAGVVYDSSVTNCFVTGAVSGSGSNIGGVAGGIFEGSMTNCYITGTVSGSNDVGGVVGSVGGSITNCYSTAAVSGGNDVGGVAGWVNYGESVTSCAALNPSVKGTTNVGRVVGFDGGGNLSGNVAFSSMTRGDGAVFNPTDPGANKKDGDSKAAADLQAIGGFPSSLTSGAWTYEAEMLPGLGAAVEMPFHLKTGSYFAGGNGSSGNPYQIETAAQLENLAGLVNDGISPYADANVHYKLMNNLTLTGEWVPIGHSTKMFKGHFDGNSKTISGLYIQNNTYFNIGLFGAVDGGSVKDLGLVGVSISGATNVGGVASTVIGGSVENCYVTGAVSGNGTVGGVAGSVTNGSSMTNCYSTGAVTGSDNGIGGVAGFVYKGSVANCYSTGAVTGDNAIGGVAGIVYEGSVTNCYSTGAVTGSDHVGGVAGVVYDSSITNCAALNPSVKGTGPNVGRVVGENDSGTSTLSGNYAFSGMTGGAFTGKTTGGIGGADMSKLQAVTPSFWTGTMMGWSGSVWTLEYGKLPVLTNLAGQNGDPGLYLTGLPTGDLTITPDAETRIMSGAPQTVDFTVLGMDNWTDRLIVWSTTAGSIVETADGKATLTVPANYTGTITVTAKNENSGQSVSATVIVATVPGAPENLTAIPGDGQVTLSWSAPADNGGSPVIAYEVYASTMPLWDDCGSDTSVTFSGLTNGQEYTFRVRAKNGAGAGPYAEVTATPSAAAVTVPVTGVSVSPASLNLNPGNTRQLTATVTPADATIRDISWSSSDLTVATVDGSGRVTAVALGSATVTATTVDGGFTATCAVTVTSTAGGYTPGGSSGGSGSGSSGSGSTTTTTTTSNTPSNVSQSQATDAAAKAVAAAKASGASTATVNMKNVGNISLAALQAMAKAAGMPVKFQADSMSADGKAVEVRITLDPAKSTKDLNLTASTSNGRAKSTKAFFEKWFKNKVSTINFGQQGDFGQLVEIAAKVDLTGMDTKKLYFYSYDKKTNTYRRIEKPAYWIDKNGYLHFDTPYAGDIIISENPLERK